MFAKLLKHEWRASAGTLGLLSLAVLGVSVLGGMVLRALTEHGYYLNEMATLGIVLSLVFMVLAMIGCAVAMQIILLVRFYKNKFTDEGYLTFTLPVSSHQIFLSSFLNMLIWTVISSLVLLAGFGVFVLIGTYNVDPVIQAVFTELKWMLSEIGPDTKYIVMLILEFIVGLPYGVVIAMTCITVGAVIAKKHKILAAFGIYYGLTYLTNIISSTVTMMLSMGKWDYLASSDYAAVYDHTMNATVQSMVVTIVWEVLLMVGGYILSTQLMKKKLNLP